MISDSGTIPILTIWGFMMGKSTLGYVRRAGIVNDEILPQEKWQQEKTKNGSISSPPISMFAIFESIFTPKKIRGSQRPIVIARKIIVAILSVSVRLSIHMYDLLWNSALQSERVAAYNEKIRLSRFPRLSASMIFVKIPIWDFIFWKKFKNTLIIFLKILKNSESAFLFLKIF